MPFFSQLGKSWERIEEKRHVSNLELVVPWIVVNKRMKNYMTGGAFINIEGPF
jgi:hypothetical protein